MLTLKEISKNSRPDGSLNASVGGEGINAGFLTIVKSCAKTLYIQGQMFEFNTF